MKTLMKSFLTLAVVAMFTVAPTQNANAAFIMGGVSRAVMDNTEDTNPMWEKINEYSLPTALGSFVLASIIGGPPVALMVIGVLDKDSENLEVVNKLKAEFLFLNNIDGLAEAIVDKAMEIAETAKVQKNEQNDEFAIIRINKDDFNSVLRGFDTEGYDQNIAELALALE